MLDFSVTDYMKYGDLPLDKFRLLTYKVYVLDREWNYLFVNDAVIQGLGERRGSLIGKNMWAIFPELRTDPAFQQMKKDVEVGKQVSFTTTSPLNMKRLSISGWPLQDCYLFTANTLPDKGKLLDELRLFSIRRPADPDKYLNLH